jgi:DNA-binding NarL/FixJ family response regulator
MGDRQDSERQLRVFFLSDESLLSMGIETLLRGETTLETASCRSNKDETLDRIRIFQPHVVILNTDEQHGETATEWMRILRDAPQIKLLGFSLRDNTLCIYSGDTQQTNEAADLLRAIKQAAQ